MPQAFEARSKTGHPDRRGKTANTIRCQWQSGERRYEHVCLGCSESSSLSQWRQCRELCIRSGRASHTEDCQRRFYSVPVRRLKSSSGDSEWRPERQSADRAQYRRIFPAHRLGWRARLSDRHSWQRTRPDGFDRKHPDAILLRSIRQCGIDRSSKLEYYSIRRKRERRDWSRLLSSQILLPNDSTVHSVADSVP
jgi:hypothetical protein